MFLFRCVSRILKNSTCIHKISFAKFVNFSLTELMNLLIDPNRFYMYGIFLAFTNIVNASVLWRYI